MQAQLYRTYDSFISRGLKVLNHILFYQSKQGAIFY